MVTCLCITRNRREWLPQAIECFEQQTYEDRELLIVADGDSVHSLIPANDPRIRLVYSDALRIGDKRNYGCALIRSELIAHWDDDDYSAPGRLTDQVERLQSSAKSVTGYHGMRFTDGKRWWRYRGPDVSGTSLCYRRDWWQAHPFASVQIGEDNLFAHEAAAGGQLVSAPAGEWMHASIHSGNTSQRHIDGPIWEEIQEMVESAASVHSV